MSHTVQNPPKKRRRSGWTLLRKGTIAVGFIASAAQATYWLLQLGHVL